MQEYFYFLPCSTSCITLLISPPTRIQSEANASEAPIVKSAPKATPPAIVQPSGSKAKLTDASSAVGAGNIMVTAKKLMDMGMSEKEIGDTLESIRRGKQADGLQGEQLKGYYQGLFK